MILSLIAAVTENFVIGNDHQMPWHLPNDLKHFKRLTLNHLMIMGRKTFASFGNQPLPGRTHIILSQKLGKKSSAINLLQNPNVVYVCDLKNALQIAEQFIQQKKNHLSTENYSAEPTMENLTDHEVFIIGGGQIYQQTIALADRIYLTKIHTQLQGDTFFPKVNFQEWQLIKEETFQHDQKHAFDYSFLTYIRQLNRVKEI